MKKLTIAALVVLMMGANTASVFASSAGEQTGNGRAGGNPTAPIVETPAAETPTTPSGGTTPTGSTATPSPTTPAVIRAPDIIAPASLGQRNASRYSYREIATTLLPSVATWLASALGALAVLFLIWAGIQFLTAEGDPEKIGAATKTALYVIAGVVLVMFAYAMVYLFLSLFVPA